MKEEVYDQILHRQEQYCPVRYCEIGTGIKCNAWELSHAVRDGSLDIPRTAYYHQANPSTSGCDLYSTEQVRIICNEDGIPVNYDIPYTNSDQNLSFRLFAGLASYGSDINGSLIGTSSPPSEPSALGDTLQEFTSLLYDAHRANRKLFPPQPIMVDEKPYEVSAVCTCQMQDCVNNSGEMNIHIPLLPSQ